MPEGAAIKDARGKARGGGARSDSGFAKVSCDAPAGESLGANALHLITVSSNRTGGEAVPCSSRAMAAPPRWPSRCRSIPVRQDQRWALGDI